MIHSRRGVTIIELLIAMVIAAILGAATLSLMMSQSRFTERAEGQRAGRRVGRSAINVLSNDLRMVDPDWGIEAASASSITVKVPYALGVVCSAAYVSPNTTHVIALLPVDSVVLASVGYSGYATRGNTGVYTPVSGGTVTDNGALTSTCTSAPANVFAITAPSSAPNQKTRQITIVVNAGSDVRVAVGTPVMLYRRTNYYFGNSNQTALSGRTALWRNYLDGGGSAVELAAPFDVSAAFRFFNGAATVSQTAVPADLTDIKGFELFLPGESDLTARKATAPEQADVTTAIFLVNRAQ
ncbi:MAG: type II secretion system protein [Gemmatimonadales bacterium]